MDEFRGGSANLHRFTDRRSPRISRHSRCVIIALLPPELRQIVFCDPHVLKYAAVLQNTFPCQGTKNLLFESLLKLISHHKKAPLKIEEGFFYEGSQKSDLCFCELLSNEIPIYEFIQECLNVFRAQVLEVEVIGMLPHVTCQ